MVLMFTWDVYGDRIGQNVTVRREENGYKRTCLGRHHHHHHHMSVMELGHLLTFSGFTCLEVCHDSFCQLGNSVSLSCVVCHEAGTFVYIFLALVMKVSYGVVSYGTVEGVGVGRASVEKVSSQMVNEVADRCDV